MDSSMYQHAQAQAITSTHNLVAQLRDNTFAVLSLHLCLALSPHRIAKHASASRMQGVSATRPAVGDSAGVRATEVVSKVPVCCSVSFSRNLSKRHFACAAGLGVICTRYIHVTCEWQESKRMRCLQRGAFTRSLSSRRH